MALYLHAVGRKARLCTNSISPEEVTPDGREQATMKSQYLDLEASKIKTIAPILPFSTSTHQVSINKNGLKTCTDGNKSRRAPCFFYKFYRREHDMDRRFLLSTPRLAAATLARVSITRACLLVGLGIQPNSSLLSIL